MLYREVLKEHLLVQSFLQYEHDRYSNFLYRHENHSPGRSTK